MRVMLRACLDNDKARDAIKSGRMQEVIQTLVEQTNPEAIYFHPNKGHRGLTAVFDMTDSSILPRIAEPFFDELGGELEIHPAMNREDLQKGLASLA